MYDADGGVVGELTYVVGHLLGRTSCSLCDLTHGSVRRRPEWDAMVARLPVPVRLVHRNEATDDERGAWSVSGLPAVLGVRADGSRTVLLGPTGLAGARRLGAGVRAGPAGRPVGRRSAPRRRLAPRPRAGDAPPPPGHGAHESCAAGSTITANRTPRPSEDEHREQPAPLTARTGDQGDHGEGWEPQRRGEEHDRRPGAGRREPRPRPVPSSGLGATTRRAPSTARCRAGPTRTAPASPPSGRPPGRGPRPSAGADPAATTA